MAVEQLPGRVREFASYLNALLARLDQGAGWCAVFWQRDPDGMRACLDGHEVPPWDVMEAVLQDLAAAYGAAAAAQETPRARSLHAAALAAHDARPGGRDALGDRLDVMLREQRYAAERQADLGRRLASATTREQADAFRLDLAWAHDDHERATARCAELRRRMAEADRLPAAGAPPGRTGPTVDAHDPRHPGDTPHPQDTGHGHDRGHGHDTGSAHDAPIAYDTRTAYDARAAGAPEARVTPDPASGPAFDPASGPAFDRAFDPAPVPDSAPAAAPAAVPKQRKRRRGSARFAGMAEETEVAPLVVPPTSAAAPGPAEPAPARRTLRGARFAGAAEAPAGRSSEPRREALDATARRETVEAVRHLVRLRAEGRSGEAHALLVDLAALPAARIPLLAAELQRAGLTADWTTLLWEAASLPADRLVAAADALVAVGRTADGEQILRQGVARPAEEIGQGVLGLVREGRRREARALLDAYVRVRSPEEAARSAAPDPQTLVPLLLEAARDASEERHWDLVHALRVAGFTA
ncbi:hypothetical protein [Streptomyces sp. NPDC012616]|uniref:hypothetical protein n=1 Tax=Streptomyces sp. NPDC012616 TaxID=3364840 RepID=UPI0036E84C80